MNHFDLVNELHRKSGASFEDAKAALEASQWDMLDALILLERQGKVKENIARKEEGRRDYNTAEMEMEKNGDVKSRMKRIWEFICMLVRKGNANDFIVTNKKHEELIAMPITVLVLLLLGFWPLSIIGLVVGLCVGGRYAFYGPDFGSKINDAMNRAADMAQGENRKK